MSHTMFIPIRIYRKVMELTGGIVWYLLNLKMRWSDGYFVGWPTRCIRCNSCGGIKVLLPCYAVCIRSVARNNKLRLMIYVRVWGANLHSLLNDTGVPSVFVKQRMWTGIWQCHQSLRRRLNLILLRFTNLIFSSGEGLLVPILNLQMWYAKLNIYLRWYQ